MRLDLLFLILALPGSGATAVAETAPKPLDKVQVLALLAGGVSSQRVAMLVEQRGIDFEPTDDYFRSLGVAGAEETLHKALRAAKPVNLPTIDAAKEAKRTELEEHLRQGVELSQRKMYKEAEEEYRAAIKLDPPNASLHTALGAALFYQKKTDGALATYREAVRLAQVDPERDDSSEALVRIQLASFLALTGNIEASVAEFRQLVRLKPSDRLGALAHAEYGSLLLQRGDIDPAIAEFRESVHLLPQWDLAHIGLGMALNLKGDRNSAIEEYRQAVSINPDNPEAHRMLGLALSINGNQVGAASELYALTRLRPDDPTAHLSLADVLALRNDVEGAIAEYSEVLRLKPDLAEAYVGLGRMLSTKTDYDGAIGKFREAIRLKPDHAEAHLKLGSLLYAVKRNYEGAAAEYREAIRLKPDYAHAHFLLGFYHEQMKDRRAALSEFRTAHLLDPNNPKYRREYERLLRKVRN